jgi:hypothetical protein
MLHLEETERYLQVLTKFLDHMELEVEPRRARAG